MPSTSDNIKVFCRFRPKNDSEKSMGAPGNVCVTFPDPSTVTVAGSAAPFVFDRVLPMDSTQEEIFSAAADPIVRQVMEGYNGTIFAYGQTSSGKTYTMEGPKLSDASLKGVIPRSVDSIFQWILGCNERVAFTLQVSMLQIYNEKLNDLLDPSRCDLKIREARDKGIYVAGLSEYYAAVPADVLNYIDKGSKNRTRMNQQSSRSHSIVILSVSQRNLQSYASKFGKLFLVDLAGSEKVEKTGATGQRLEEAKSINKSLFTLGLVISALTDPKAKAFVPYRDSQLTRLLQESLGGNSKTALICNCSPVTFNMEETISTLRFATTAKSIKNKPRINMEQSPQELKSLLEAANAEIAKMKLVIDAARQNSEDKHKNDQQSPTVAELQGEIIDLKTQIAQIESEFQEVVGKNDFLNQQLNEKKAQFESVERNMKAIADERRELEQERREMQTSLEDNSVMIDSYKRQVEDLQARNNQHIAMTATLTSELNKARNELSRAILQNDTSSMEIAQLKSQLEDGKVDSNGLNDLKNKYETHIQKMITAHQSEIGNLKDINTALHQEMENMRLGNLQQLEELQKKHSKEKKAQKLQEPPPQVPPCPGFRFQEIAAISANEIELREKMQTSEVPQFKFQIHPEKNSVLSYFSSLKNNLVHVFRHKTLQWGEKTKDPEFEEAMKNNGSRMVLLTFTKKHAEELITSLDSISPHLLAPAGMINSLSCFVKGFEEYFKIQESPVYHESVYYSNFIGSAILPVLNQRVCSTSLTAVQKREMNVIVNYISNKVSILELIDSKGRERTKIKMEYEHYYEKVQKLTDRTQLERNNQKLSIAATNLKKMDTYFYSNYYFYQHNHTAFVNYEYNAFKRSVHSLFAQVSHLCESIPIPYVQLNNFSLPYHPDLPLQSDISSVSPMQSSPSISISVSGRRIPFRYLPPSPATTIIYPSHSPESSPASRSNVYTYSASPNGAPVPSPSASHSASPANPRAPVMDSYRSKAYSVSGSSPSQPQGTAPALVTSPSPSQPVVTESQRPQRVSSVASSVASALPSLGSLRRSTRQCLDDDEFVVVALHSLRRGPTAEYLTFEKNDLIVITEDLNKDWFWGDLGDRSGYVPKNYVKKMDC